jgi:hypothetical protein
MSHDAVQAAAEQGVDPVVTPSGNDRSNDYDAVALVMERLNAMV